MRTLFALGIAALSLGATTGFLVGLSWSPVVGILLPLLFGALGGTGVIYSAQLDFLRPQTRDAAVRVAIMVVALSIGIIAGVMQGMNYRWADQFWPEPLAAVRGDANFLGWVLLDARLRQVGLTRDQRADVLRGIQTTTQNPGPPIDLAGELEALGTDIAAAVPLATEIDETARSEWLRLQDATEQLVQLHSALPEAQRATAVRDGLASLRDETALARDDEADLAFLSGDEQAHKALGRFELRVAGLIAAIGSSTPPLEQANTLLEAYLSSDREVLSGSQPFRGLAGRLGSGVDDG